MKEGLVISVQRGSSHPLQWGLLVQMGGSGTENEGFLSLCCSLSENHLLDHFLGKMRMGNFARKVEGA